MMVVNIIINCIVDSRIGILNEKCYLPVFFYADDGWFVYRSYGEPEHMIAMVV